MISLCVYVLFCSFVECMHYFAIWAYAFCQNVGECMSLMELRELVSEMGGKLARKRADGKYSTSTNQKRRKAALQPRVSKKVQLPARFSLRHFVTAIINVGASFFLGKSTRATFPCPPPPPSTAPLRCLVTFNLASCCRHAA